MSQSIRDKWCEKEISDIDYIRCLEEENTKLKEHKTCEWKMCDHEWNTYKTGCGQYFNIMEGALKDNDFNYCSYCGSLINEPKEQ